MSLIHVVTGAHVSALFSAVAQAGVWPLIPSRNDHTDPPPPQPRGEHEYEEFIFQNNEETWLGRGKRLHPSFSLCEKYTG